MDAYRPDSAIGGYFPLEIGAARQDPYPGSIRFQSARAALAAVLLETRPARAWLPALICDAAVAGVAHAGVPVSFYSLDPATGLPRDARLGKGDVLLWVNYFGVMSWARPALFDQVPPGQVILDNSQAFFAAPQECLANVYSPRKFFGVPDGGLLVTHRPVPAPAEVDGASAARGAHLLQALAGPPEPGYAAFVAAERSLEDCRPRAMSPMTRRLLASIDLDAVAARRRHNLQAMRERFEPYNRWPFPVAPDDVPLCYPFLRSVPRDNTRITAQRVYLATYWADARARCPPGSFERTLIENLLPLPIDQRYHVDDAFLARLAAAGIAPGGTATGPRAKLP